MAVIASLALKILQFAMRYPPSLVPSEKPNIIVCRIPRRFKCALYVGFVYNASITAGAAIKSGTVSKSGETSAVGMSQSQSLKKVKACITCKAL